MNWVVNAKGKFDKCTDKEIQILISSYSRSSVVAESTVGMESLVKGHILEAGQKMTEGSAISIYRWNLDVSTLQSVLLAEVNKRAGDDLATPAMIAYQASLVYQNPALSREDINLLQAWRIVSSDFGGRIGNTAFGLAYIQRYVARSA